MKKEIISWSSAILFFGVLFLIALTSSSCSNSNFKELDVVTFNFEGNDTVVIIIQKGEIVDTAIWGYKFRLSIDDNISMIEYIDLEKVMNAYIYDNLFYGDGGLITEGSVPQITNAYMYDNLLTFSWYEWPHYSKNFDYIEWAKFQCFDYDYSWTDTNSGWMQPKTPEVSPTTIYYY